ncbi:MAG: hypothetical protein K6E73_07840 [Bacteroidales bacterium]|nr:hypothetical protein [Bacteroidales bacterium]
MIVKKGFAQKKISLNSRRKIALCIYKQSEKSAIDELPNLMKMKVKRSWKDGSRKKLPLFDADEQVWHHGLISRKNYRFYIYWTYNHAIA